MTFYETIILTKTSIDDSTYTSLIRKIEEAIKRHRGEVAINDKWGSRRLAYPIKKEASGVYTYLGYCGDNELVHEVERQLRNQDYVLRYLSVKVDEESVSSFGANYKTANWSARSNLSDWSPPTRFSRFGGRRRDEDSFDDTRDDREKGRK